MGYVQTAGVRVHPVPGERFPPLLAEVVQLIPVLQSNKDNRP